jgi:serine/threonine-protein kinase
MAQWFRELCDVLSYVHGNAIVHRDIKLSNILIAPEKHVILSDFGISKVHDEQLRSDVNVSCTYVTNDPSAKLVMGTAGYIAPEVARGEECTPAADVYSLGVVFFKLLTGVWYDPCLASGDRNAIKLLEHFELDWKSVLPAMLDENPEKRPSDLKTLADRLCTLPAGARLKTPSKKRKKRVMLIVSVIAAVLAAATGWVLFSSIAQTRGLDPLDYAFAIPESVK